MLGSAPANSERSNWFSGVELPYPAGDQCFHGDATVSRCYGHCTTQRQYPLAHPYHAEPLLVIDRKAGAVVANADRDRVGFHGEASNLANWRRRHGDFDMCRAGVSKDVGQSLLDDAIDSQCCRLAGLVERS